MSRQTLIDGWIQDAVSEATAMVVGCGALGSQVAISLVRLGINEMVLVDADILETHNLENQAYTQHDIGRPKVEALAAILRQIRPGVHIVTLRARVQDVQGIQADWIFGCLDNVAGRHYLNHLALTWPATLIDGGIESFRGAVRIIQGGTTACLSCHGFHVVPAAGSCSTEPIPSAYVTANVVANLQVMQFLRLLHGWPVSSHLGVDLRRDGLHANNIPPLPECEACHG